MIVTTPATAQPPTLVVIRGNSGSGKSTIARRLQRQFGRGLARVEQDYLRREVLREHGSDSTATVAPGFIMATVCAALDAGYHVLLEGILHSNQYGGPIRELITRHPGPSYAFWLEVTFGETLRRHAGRPELAHVTAETMRGWYTSLDLLGVPGEQAIEEMSGVEDSVQRILHHTGLDRSAALTPCPLTCPRCARENAEPSVDMSLP